MPRPHHPHLRLVRDNKAHSLVEIASEFAGSVVMVNTPLLPRQLPPLKPRRPAAAVRKSLRTALIASADMVEHVRDADARYPARAQRAVAALQAYAKRIADLSAELTTAIERERNYHRWRAGKSYVE